MIIGNLAFDAGALGAHTRAELAQTRGTARAAPPMPFSTPSSIHAL